ncbi:MAG: 5'/3'-nucleotidase SurE, partial [Planctomycetota bacterium]|nr:5'/3'-nucleotidase SurE [Planctomycetota bacterium]
SVVRLATPRGETAFWIGPAGDAQDAGPGTDFYAVAQNRVSVTPLQVDLTFHAQIELVRRWMGQ